MTGDNFDRKVIHAYIGETTTLKCPLLSQNLSDVQWIHLDSKTVYSIGMDINPKIDNMTGRTKFKIVGNHDIGEYNLKIIEIEREDKGVYRCDSEINGKPESRFIHFVVDGNTFVSTFSLIIKQKFVNEKQFTNIKLNKEYTPHGNKINLYMGCIKSVGVLCHA